MGVLRDKSKKEASGWDGRGLATGIYLTKHSCQACVCLCVLVCVRVFGERKKERKDYGNTSSLAHSNRGKHHKALARTTCTHTPACTHTHRQTLGSSPPSLLAFPPGPPSSEGGQKEGSRAQITTRLILTGFSLYTKAYKNNERGFGSS